MKIKRIYQIVALQLLAISAVVAAPTTTERHYLSGTDRDNTVEWNFFCSDGMQSGEWTKIAVPSCWELQGFGHYNYGSSPMEKRPNEYGLYSYDFAVPREWRGRTVRMVFEGVMTDATVKINGKLAGEKHQGAFYEFKYDVSDRLKYGATNKLEVRVDKASSNESINHAEREADFWLYGGIYRPVYLEVMPEEYIDRVAVAAEASGDIRADIFTTSKAAEGVSIDLEDLLGNKIQSLTLSREEQSEGKWSIETKAESIKTWDPEHPNLYALKISINDAKGRELHSVTQRIGFRTVVIRESDGIYVNGERIKFKGVNRHSFHPESGRTTSKALSIEHVKMMKDMNMNAVRMSHYPPDVHFLDVCDSLGLFVTDEVCTWHTPKLDTEVGRKIVEECVTRDVNHPSILLWANGNETGWNTELDDDYAKWDIQKREVMHPWNVFRKNNTLHYPPYHGILNDARSQDRIIFHTEYLHGLYDGGHGAGLEDFWNIQWNMPLSAGGFLWCFIDEAVVRTDKNGILDADGNHAADGIVGPYGEKEASYYTIKEIWSPIYIEDRFIRDDFNGLFRIENRYFYTNLDECSMEAKWMKFNDKEGSVMSRSAVKLPALEPMGTGRFTVDRPENWREADALHLTARDYNGNEIFTWSYPVKQPEKVAAELVEYPATGSIEERVEGDELVVRGGEFEYRFARASGRILGVKRGDVAIPLTEGPMILDQAKVVKESVDTLITTRRAGAVDYTFVFEKSLAPQEWVKTKKMASDTITWSIYDNGLVDMRVVTKSRKKVVGYKGISFKFPESEVSGMRWLGDGPYRVWRNRMKGTRFQVWENDYNDTRTGEDYVYPEFKGFFSSLYWADIFGRQSNGFKVYCHTPFVYLRMFTPRENTDFTRGNPIFKSFPAGDISFVMNIPAMGTKFLNPDQTGPHGNTEVYYGNYDEPLEFKLTFDFK